MNAAAPCRALVIAFSVLIAGVPVLQCALEWQRGGSPGLLRVFGQSPTRASLAAFERSIEEESVTVRSLRPRVQAGQFFFLKDGGAKVHVGRDGWLFYTPGVNAITRRPARGESTVEEAVAAVTSFRDALAGRGIRLIVLPVPNKESVYPQQFSASSGPPGRIINPDTREFFDACKEAGVEVVDLFACYREAADLPCYLVQDTHWSPHGVDVAARAVAERIGVRGSTRFETEDATIEVHGDLVRMLRSPVIESRLEPERIGIQRVVGAAAARAPVLVIGDSFSRVFETDEPGGAGFISRLALHLGEPVAGLVNDGGASTLVRQELFRRPRLLEGTKVVVWEFTERDLRLGTEGWQVVPLPPPAP